MSTHSTIIVNMSGNRGWFAVSCNFDGYLEGVGYALRHAFNDQSKAEDLVLGRRDLRCINNDGTIEQYDDGEMRRRYPSLEAALEDEGGRGSAEYIYVWPMGFDGWYPMHRGQKVSWDRNSR